MCIDVVGFLSQYINAIRKPALLYMHIDNFVMKYSHVQYDQQYIPRLIYKRQAEVNKDKAIIKEPESLMASKFFRM